MKSKNTLRVNLLESPIPLIGYVRKRQPLQQRFLNACLNIIKRLENMNGLDLGQEVYALFSEGLFKET